MLKLTLRHGEAVWIGEKDKENIKVIILNHRGNQIGIGIEAPQEINIVREKLWLKNKKEINNENNKTMAS
jgi:carbon storage regulator CsrA